ncbi:DNA primase [Candidatus Kaiserbacteria bacterium]|nr:DNA primase [Candidatus Kaiserbacteria bacterium]
MAGDTVQQIKERLNIQDIVAPYVKLRKAGRSMVGLCPFHKEKTASFHVSSERGTWHCFGCGLGGDGFSFIEKVEGVDFKGALKMLAEKAGVTLEYRSRSPEDGEKKDRLRALMSRASEWYAGKFSKSPAEEYAKKRGLTDKTVTAWRLGYAPNEWRALLEALTAEGFTVPEMLAAGLIKEADGKPGTYYDRFRNRLMFPIRDVAGRVVAFTGRALASDDVAKYLNSPETELYHKSEILFGMDFAKDAIRTRKFTMLVEGQMDVILTHQAGFENAVALSGTALTDRHLGLMKRYSENLMLVLDADTAGLTATARSAELALRQGLRVKAARLPKGKDPAELIAPAGGGSASGGKEFSKRVSDAKPIVDFFLAELAERESDPHRLLRAAENIVLPLIGAVQSPMEREHFTQSAARALGLSVDAVRESVKHLPASLERKRGEPKLPDATHGSSTQGVVASPARPAREVRSEQLLAIVHAYPNTPLAKRVTSEYIRITEAKLLPREALPEPALFLAEQTFGAEPSEDSADELLRAFEEAVIREAYQEAVTHLRKAEAAGDAAAVKGAQETCASLSARLAKFGQ